MAGTETHNILVLVRHGQSEWNLKNLFTGWRDVGLTAQGIAEARAAGTALAKLGLSFDEAFTSRLARARRTLDLMLEELGQEAVPVTEDAALNERDYGDLTGLDKNDARAKWGDEQVHIWRRSYDVPPPNGESLKGTGERVLPYYRAHILPRVLAGKSILVAAHGNSLRALVMELEGMSEDEITRLNIATGTPRVYRLNGDGRVLSKELVAI